MLFQGQEFASTRPFLYFADHKLELAAAIRKGRVEFLSQFPSLTDDRLVDVLPSPDDETTFMRSKLDLSERERHAAAYALHCDLLALRHGDPVLARAGTYRPEGAVLGRGALLLRYLDAVHGDRLLIVNLDCDLDFTPAREPLLAAPFGSRWTLAWSSEAPQYGGQGVPPFDPDGPWRIPGSGALFFVSEPR
jgi:maltooligosyltrehalose trehalohydrolase